MYKGESNIRKNNKKPNFFNNINYWFITIGFMIEISIGLIYFRSAVFSDSYFGMMSLIQGILCLFTFFVINIILFSKFNISYKNLRMPSSYTFIRVLVILAVVSLPQILIFVIVATVKDYEKVLAIAFAGVCEEMIFRALIIGPFIRIRKHYNSKNVSFSFDIEIPVLFEKKKNKRYIRRKYGILELTAILISATLFTSFHFNYYGNFLALLSVYIGGLIWAFFYIYWNDITSLILSHFTINFIFSIRTFYGVNLSIFSIAFINYIVLFIILLIILCITIIFVNKYENFIKKKD